MMSVVHRAAGARYPTTRLPVLFDVDSLVLGGSLGCVAAALTLADAGRSVALVEPRTYLGRERTATLRPWLDLPASAGLPEPLASFVERLRVAGVPVDGRSRLPFAPDALKLHLEDRLLAAGVELLYASLPLAVLHDDGGITGVVIGNKSGRQLVACRSLVDGTETAITARLAGARFRPASGTPSRTLEFDGVGALPGDRLRVPERLRLVDDEVLFHPGHRGDAHVLVEVRLAGGGPGTRAAPRDAIEAAALEMDERARTMDVAAHLMTDVPAFEGAYLAATSLEGPCRTIRTDTAPPAWAGALDGRWLGAGTEAPVALSSLAGPHRGHLFLGEAAGDGLHALASDPAFACTCGAELARHLLATWRDATAGPGAASAVTARRADPHPDPGGLEIREPASPQRGRRFPCVSVGGIDVPTLRTADVIVVGGGTSGATAATTAAEEGLATVLVEMNPGLGGTGTYGGVNDYWFGRRVGFAARLSAAVAAYHACLRHDAPEGEVPRWNIEAKAHVLLRAAERAGVEVLFDAIVIGAITRGAEVRGVVVATRYGPVALFGTVVIDATGDGDVAAHAGAPTVYGSRRDHVTMWYSLAQFGLPGRTRNNFTSTVDVGNVLDYTRAILAGRRRTRSEMRARFGIHDHGIYVAPRESRHVLGEVELTLTDQLLRRAWPDTVSVAFSNNDVKGHTGSDWVRLGLISPNLEVEVPYRALVPLGLENVLVVGKAISATHDALPAIRMQADLENLGGVAALAAAQAIAEGVAVRSVDVARLQRRLVDAGVLPPGVAARVLLPWQPTDEELRGGIDRLTGERPLYAYSDMRINEVYRGRIPLVDVCCAGPRAVGALAEAHEGAEGARRVLLAQALSIVGSRSGVPTLLEAIDAQLAGGTLPPRAAGIPHAVAPPDQGAMPEVAYLVHALGMARDARALPVWERIVALLEGVRDDDLRDPRKDVFDYVDAVCIGAERLGDPAALPILERLHGYGPFRGRSDRAAFQVDHVEERQAYLELVIARAMARCGSWEGVRVLVDYLDDRRASLAEHAHSELAGITGTDHGKDASAWRAWLDERLQRDAVLPTSPWTAPTDAVAAWGLDVLLAPAGPPATPARADPASAPPAP